MADASIRQFDLTAAPAVIPVPAAGLVLFGALAMLAGVARTRRQPR